jgi:hypothetical protein
VTEKPSKKQELWDWINSLNPITIDVDDEGNPTNPEQLNQLTERLETEIKEIRNNEQQ